MRAMTFCSLFYHQWLIVTLKSVSWTHAFDQPTFKIPQFFLFIITWNRKLFFSNLSSAIRLHYRNIQNWCQEKVEDISNEAVPTWGHFRDLAHNLDEAFVECFHLCHWTKAVLDCLWNDCILAPQLFSFKTSVLHPLYLGRLVAEQGKPKAIVIRVTLGWLAFGGRHYYRFKKKSVGYNRS